MASELTNNYCNSSRHLSEIFLFSLLLSTLSLAFEAYALVNICIYQLICIHTYIFYGAIFGWCAVLIITTPAAVVVTKITLTITITITIAMIINIIIVWLICQCCGWQLQLVRCKCYILVCAFTCIYVCMCVMLWIYPRGY